MNREHDATRRKLLKGGAVAAVVATTPLFGTLQAFAARNAQGRNTGLVRSSYGPLRPARDLSTGLELLQLPDGFQYRSFSWTGDPMDNGQPVPGSHDGMGVVEVRRGSSGPEIVLVRNHEAGTGNPIDARGVYDGVTLANGQRPAGGTTNLYVPRGIDQPVRTLPSLGGTRTNCAGGVTPWGTWLSCEETTVDYSSVGGRAHGYVFEVTADPALTTGQPLVQMGRFAHEAVAVDPRNSYVYLTEDARNRAGYYRFIPTDASQQPSSLAAGGILQAARVRNRALVDLHAPTQGDSYQLEWVEVPNPDLGPQPEGSGPFVQARQAGALSMSRGEGICHRDGKLYIVDTSAGTDAQGRAGYGRGAVWVHDLATDRLTCLFASTDAEIANNPDNITISPRGGVVLCEDGGGVQDAYGFGERLLGLTAAGEAYIFAKNNVVFDDVQAAAAGKKVSGGDYRNREFCGACFDPTGHFLFVNIQTPGITFAIWGPWARGAL
ncbi:PhoX family protein [Pseudomonas sp.]|uniref:PhoX family protein n=1 Tax=Pseudomonas sp. TaxID=306 RepID=UPI0028AA6779|nr:alkaline phosphatase PhoX [Pseudomonas sp.]